MLEFSCSSKIRFCFSEVRPTLRRACEREFFAVLIQEAALAQTFDSYEERKGLTFAQAEGAEPLPSQLRRDHLTPRLRAKLWNSLYPFFDLNRIHSDETYQPYGHWVRIGELMWVDYLYQMIDQYPGPHVVFQEILKGIIEKRTYIDVFGALQFLIRRAAFPKKFIGDLDYLLKSEGSAFRIINNDTFCPVGSSHEAEAVQSAVAKTSKSNLQGARKHLLEAASQATVGEFASSVRESIHSVESVARILGGTKDSLNQALAKLEAEGVVHKAMKTGFAALYGYTSDEKGIRHALLDQGDAQVTEADALFMLGACASFVTYMITRARAAGLLTEA